MITEQDLVRIAKRENNKKRTYLVVNRKQGKHIPVSPKEALGLFEKLAGQLRQEYGQERVLVIGFAETATAIGAAVAVELDSMYIQTTREVIGREEYLWFSEEHSHAAEQKLVKEDITAALLQAERIVFVEDEITTGKTILNIVDVLERAYGKKHRIAAASLLNGMSLEHMRAFADRDISLHYLVKTDHRRYGAMAESCQGDGCYKKRGEPQKELKLTRFFGGYQNARRIVTGKSYQESCEQLWQFVKSAYPAKAGGRILVLGTEEFMYPPLYTAWKLEQQGSEVRFHATTRSPIAVSSETDYPLKTRYELISLYDESRITYLYELAAYDQVFVITDAKTSEEGSGIRSLFAALEMAGNQDIQFIRWCER